MHLGTRAGPWAPGAGANGDCCTRRARLIRALSRGSGRRTCHRVVPGVHVGAGVRACDALQRAGCSSEGRRVEHAPVVTLHLRSRMRGHERLDHRRPAVGHTDNLAPRKLLPTSCDTVLPARGCAAGGRQGRSLAEIAADHHNA